MKKLLALILAVLTLLTMLVACVEKVPDETGDPSATTEAPSSSDVVTDFKDQGDNTVADLDQQIINILAWEDAEQIEFEYDSNDVTMSSINDALLERNKAVENRLNCILKFTYTPGNYNNLDNYIKKVEAYDNGSENEFMDIYAAYSMTTASLSTKGFCANLMNLTSETGLDFNKPWWPETMVAEGMFDNKLYVCTGDISTNLLWMMETMYFNKDLMVTYGHTEDELYTIVENGEWTMEKFLSYVYDTYADTDADNAFSAGDTYGYTLGTWNGYIDDFYVGCGFQFFERDAEGKLQIASTLGGEKEDNLVNMLYDFGYDDSVHMNTSDPDVFKAGRAIFTNNRARYASRLREDTEVSYGIMPMPKYDTLQENYSTNIGFPHTLYSVSASSEDRMNAATVLQSLAAQSYLNVTPVLFEETLKLRYSPELEDAKMFDILKNTLCFDVGRTYCKSVNDYSWSIFRNCIYGHSKSYITQIKALMPAISGPNGYLQTLVDALTNADD